MAYNNQVEKLTDLKTFIFFFFILICVLAAGIVNYYYNVDIVYTHLFYIPIILAGLWYPDKAVITALFLSGIHILCDYLSFDSINIAPFLRSVVFLTLAIVTSHLTRQRNRYYSELEMLNNAMLDMITRIDKSGYIEYITPSVISILGYKPEEILGKNFFDFIHPEEVDSIKEEFRKAIETKDSFVIEHRLKSVDGRYIWCESVGKPSINNKGHVDVYIFGSRDITLRKKMEEEIKYQSIHDPLTGLYNRVMFEEELKRLGTGRFNPVGIIICDLDGLKIINDNLGHYIGDCYIIAAAELLKEQCRTSDVVARIGGDEFAILIQECNEEKIKNICSRINNALADRVVPETNTHIFMSIGWAIGDGKDGSVSEILKEADDTMYYYKTQNRKIVRKAIEKLIKTLKSTL